MNHSEKLNFNFQLSYVFRCAFWFHGSVNIEFPKRSLCDVLGCWPLLLIDSELIAAQVLDAIANFRLQQLRLHPFCVTSTQTNIHLS